MAEDALEVLYEPPQGSLRARAASWAAAALFVAFVLWLTLRLLRSVTSVLVAAAVTAAVLAAQARYATGGVRATLRVTADRSARTVTWTWRGGERTLTFDEIASVTAGTVTGSDGVDLAAVTVTRSDGEALRFGVYGDAAAKGIVEALGALRSG